MPRGPRVVCLIILAASTLAPRPVAAGIGYRHWIGEPGGLRSWSEIYEEMRELARAYPSLARLQEIGRSSEGRPLYALRIADDPSDLSRPSIFLVAAHHANEAATPEHVMDAVRTLLWDADREPYATWLHHMALVAVPMVNPDGSHAFWNVDHRLGRKNQRRVTAEQSVIGVDLNRNYPFGWSVSARKSSRDPSRVFYRGPAPASEPEVRAMIALARRAPPVGMLTYHSAAGALLVPYAIPGMANPRPSAAWSVADDVIAAMPHTFANGRTMHAIGALYPVSGVEKDWYHHTFGTLAYLIELPYRRPRGELLQQSIEHTRAAWKVLFERWLAGPSLSVRAVDRDGLPLLASVAIDQIETRAGEMFRTDPDNGWFHIYLPGPGPVTVRLGTAEVEIVRELDVWGWTRIEVVVEPPDGLAAQ